MASRASDCVIMGHLVCQVIARTLYALRYNDEPTEHTGTATLCRFSTPGSGQGYLPTLALTTEHATLHDDMQLNFANRLPTRGHGGARRRASHAAGTLRV